MRELDRLVGADALPPQRARHAVDELAPSGMKLDGRWARRELRQVQLAPVVAVRQVDLLEHRLARGVRRRRPAATRQQRDERRAPAQRPHARTAFKRLVEARAQQSHRLVDLRRGHVERRHEAHRAHAAGQQQQAIVVRARRSPRRSSIARRRAIRSGLDQLHADHQAAAAHVADARVTRAPARAAGP